MPRIASYLFLVFLATPLSVFSAPLNAGFVQGLWYADEQVFADEATRIYVAFRNNTPDDLTGTVHFSVDGVRVGSSDVRVLSGRVVEAWVDWIPTYGEHDVTTTVDNVVLHQIGGKAIPAEISGLSAKDTLTVDRDTDEDGVGDKRDTDDDNDGASDEDEEKRGTDPRVADAEEEEDEETAVPRQSAAVSDAKPTEGFERYLGDGSARTLLGGITSQVTEAKQSIDAYRKARIETMRGDLLPNDQASGNATITRSSIEETEGGLWHMLVRGGKALVAHVWTFILWLASNILAHPALVQFLLLLGILYGLFKFTRRFARRPGL